MTSPETGGTRRRRTAGSRQAITALAVLAAGAGAALEPVDRIVLRVNSEIATLAEYEGRKAVRVDQVAAASDLDVATRRHLVAEAGRVTMKELFEELLVLSRAQQLHMEISPAQLDRATDNAKQRFGIETDEQFEAALAQQGLTPESFRDRMARTLLFNQVVEREVQSKIVIEDDEVARYWQSHHDEFRRLERRRLEEVVVREEAALSVEERLALARDIAARAGGGVPLAEAALAAAAAAGSADAVTGVIDHGWIEQGELAGALDSAAFGLVAPGVAEPVPGRGGLHVVRVAEIEPEAQRPLAEVEEQIRNRLGQERFETRTREFLDEQAALAYIVESLPDDAVGYRTAATGTTDPLRALLEGDAPAVEDDAPAVEDAPPAAVEPAPEPPGSSS